MRGALLPVGALLLLAAAAWWLLAGAGSAPPAHGGSEQAAASGKPEPGRLDLLSGSVPPGAATEPSDGDGPERETVGAEEFAAGQPATFFRGRLRVASGELSLAPALEARIRAEPNAPASRHRVLLDDRTLEFEIAARGARPACELVFREILAPVSADGAAFGDSASVPLLPAPAENLIEVTAAQHLAIQCLHDPSDRPLAEGRIELSLESDGSSVSWAGELDERGRYFFDSRRLEDMETAKELRITVAWPPEIGGSAAPAIPVADLWLLPQPLVLRFAGTPTLHFRVVDPDRMPIAGARVRLGGGPMREATSDADGRASALQSSPPAADVRVLAAGFLAATEPLTAASEVEQEVMLWPGSWIEIVGAEKPNGTWSEIGVEILFDGDADGSLLAPERFQTGRFTVSSGGVGTSSSRKLRRYKHNTSLNDQGLATLDGIHVDVPATVRVSYRGAVLLETRVPIQPGDGGHRVDVPELPELVPLGGRVTDLAGRALAGVEVRAGFGERSSERASTDENGEFRLQPVPIGVEAVLYFERKGFAPARRVHIVRGGAGESVGPVTMEPGRRVLLRLVDPDGVAVIPADHRDEGRPAPTVRWNGRVYTANADGNGLGPGEWQFVDLPPGEVEFVMGGGWSRFSEQSMAADTSAPVVVFELRRELAEALRRE